MHDRREWWGWVLFLVSAVLFLIVGIRDRDILVGMGSVAFLFACLLFLRAYPKKEKLPAPFRAGTQQQGCQK